jgi:predicted nucleic acid-binding protein
MKMISDPSFAAGLAEGNQCAWLSQVPRREVQVRRILLDTNIVLDVLHDRHPHAKTSGAVWRAVERKRAQGYLAGHGVTTIYYLARKKDGAVQAREIVDELLKVFSIASVDEGVLHEAVRASTPDFGDAVTAAAARAAGCGLIVSRDPRGFRGSTLPCLSPDEVLPLLT